MTSPSEVVGHFPQLVAAWLASAVAANIVLTYVFERYYPHRNPEDKYIYHVIFTLWLILIPFAMVFGVVIGPFYLVNRLARHHRRQDNDRKNLEKTLKNL
jgi:heme/copper-type cytochrome/quinol oxidase subunit 2